MIVQYTYKANGSSEIKSVKLLKLENGDEPFSGPLPKWVFYVVMTYARKWSPRDRSGQYRVIRKSKQTAGVRRLGFCPPTQDVQELNQAIQKGIPI